MLNVEVARQPAISIGKLPLGRGILALDEQNAQRWRRDIHGPVQPPACANATWPFLSLETEFISLHGPLSHKRNPAPRADSWRHGITSEPTSGLRGITSARHLSCSQHLEAYYSVLSQVSAGCITFQNGISIAAPLAESLPVRCINSSTTPAKAPRPFQWECNTLTRPTATSSTRHAVLW